MASKLRGSHLIALLIAAGVGGWMLQGDVVIGGQSENKAPPIAEREAERSSKAFRVRVVSLQPSERISRLLIRGRTKANAMVSVRAETGGTVEKRAVNKGETIKPGDLLCVIDRGIRETSLAQAKASLTQAQEDFSANQKLIEKGFTTKSKMRGLRSALNAAKASIANAELELKRTEIRATTAGVVVEPYAEIGNNLKKGDICVTLMNADPMLFVGQVSERDIATLSIGQNVGTRLVTGEEVLGKISYIDPVADAKTRTFKVEIELPNPNGTLRDGVTASSVVQLTPTSAYKVKPSWLTLADNGAIGVRIVKDDDTVEFVPLKILSQSEDTMWVAGLSPGVRVITVGQDYVVAGETVVPVDMTKEQMQSASSTHGAVSNDKKMPAEGPSQ